MATGSSIGTSQVPTYRLPSGAFLGFSEIFAEVTRRRSKYLKFIGGDEPKIEWFKKSCKDIGVKPIVLDLENSGESVMKDVMTSSHIVGNNTSAYKECARIVKQLEWKGFKVVRKKIETVPWHPAAPSENTDKMPEDCYFEAHIGCIITNEGKETLQRLAGRLDSHLSRNFFKKLEDGKFINM